MIIEEYIMCPC